MPPRVLLVCRSFPAHRAGGMEWHAQDLLRGLVDAGCTVDVLTAPLPEKPVLTPLETNGRIHEHGSRNAGRYSLAWFTSLRSRVEAICRESGIQVVHAQGFAGVALAGLQTVPMVTTIHGTLWSETALATGRRTTDLRLLWRYKHRLAFSPLWRRFLRGRPLLIVDSAFTARELERECPGLRPHVVPLGLDLRRHPEPASCDAPTGPRRIVSIGRLAPEKGYRTLLRGLTAGRFGPELQLVLAGTGPEEDTMRDFIRQQALEGTVTMPGRMEDPDLPGFLGGADWFVNPDEGNPAFGLTIAQALIFGIPVLASAVGAHPELIGEGDGVLVAERRWTEALAGILAKPRETTEARLARSLRARARFDSRSMVAAVLDHYARAIGEHSR